MTDHAGKPRDARPDLVHDQAELLDQADDPDDDDADRDDPVTDADPDRKTMGVDCHVCETALSPNTGLGGTGYRLRSGVCPHCRVDGKGSTTVVELDDQVADLIQKKLERAQRSASAQSTYSAAVFLDQRVPAGDYEVRRVRDVTVQVILPDDMDDDARMELTERYRDADVWYVQSFPDRINLVDRNFGSTDDTDADLAGRTITGP